MRIPELTTRIHQGLLDRHAQVNHVEAIAALRAVAEGRQRLTHAADKASLRAGGGKQRKDEVDTTISGSSSDEPLFKHRGRFIDVEV
jgi:hypothetical protein